MKEKKGYAMFANAGRPYTLGVTLLELMVVIAIIAIIGTAAYPSYQSYLIQSRRNDAISGMFNIQAWVEQQKALSATDAYPSDLSGYIPASSPFWVSTTTMNSQLNYYLLKYTSLTTSYVIYGYAQNSQIKDLTCYQYQLYSSGLTVALNSIGATVTPVSTCW
jgi:type IV pilus assembly protein PilE